LRRRRIHLKSLLFNYVTLVPGLKSGKGGEEKKRREKIRRVLMQFSPPTLFKASRLISVAYMDVIINNNGIS